MNTHSRHRSTHSKAGILKLTDIFLTGKIYIYFLLFLALYLYGIYPLFAYMGFVSDFSAANLAISTLYIAFAAPFIKTQGGVANFFLTLAVNLILVPTLVLYTGGGLDHIFALFTFLAIFAIYTTSAFINVPRLSMPQISMDKMLKTLVICSAGTIALGLALGGAKSLNFSFSAVYEFRKESADNLPTIFAYLNPMVSKIFIPFSLLFAIHLKRKYVAAFVTFLSIMMFGLTSHKSPIFYPLLVIFFYYTATSKKILHHLVLALIAITILSVADMFLDNLYPQTFFGWFSSLMSRRALLIPSFLNWTYLDYFQGVEKYYWSNSKLSFGLTENIHDLTFSNLIGAEIFRNEEMSANTGWIGSGYAQAGFAGIMVYSIAIGLLFSFLESYSKKLSFRIVVPLFSIPVFTLLTSADLTTMILTHGLAISLLILTVLKAKSFD